MEFFEELNKTVFVPAFSLSKDSNYQINTNQFGEDINKAINILNMEKYRIVGIQSVISGKGINNAGLGYSYTEGVLILAEKFIK
ncbi:MAG: hypothetical protein EVJ48_02970 [Candidatus Acidulodesulfobacterium acidiphilum]|uniref:Uncharacterized protein n=1 Tax=Candidatus Acidulodesulfobacterium acidiphilum TaxID=2597224 RepID=A0A520XFE5_9DELT|nr:MAG: hypothetical protein EVJ48_02970 [Candidatus Acidulodesulfobacterium acidiphilum]